MKLIIEIPEEEYKHIKDYPNVFNSKLHKAIANGTPYEEPEVKGDLISRKALKEKLSGKEYITYTQEYGDAIPIEWVMSSNYCPDCGADMRGEEE